jgi:hypothetical protein
MNWVVLGHSPVEDLLRIPWWIFKLKIFFSLTSSSAMKLKVVSSSEKSVDYTKLHDVTSQKIVFFMGNFWLSKDSLFSTMKLWVTCSNGVCDICISLTQRVWCNSGLDLKLSSAERYEYSILYVMQIIL